MTARRPLAARHLARLHELSTVASVCRAALERDLVDLLPLREAAAADRTVAEEAEALARERGWALPETTPYAWAHVGTESDPLPRVLRVLDRDLFELDGIARATDDEEVRALALQALGDRRAARAALAEAFPLHTLPGAK